MEQLKMYFLPTFAIPDDPLPPGYSISAFDPTRDLHAWCDCLRNGRLIEGQTDEEAYRDSILAIPEIVPERDILFLDHNGEHVGTATGFVYEKTNIGDLHMVGIREDYRGKGLSKYLTNAVLRLLLPRNPRLIQLTTDEKRVAAVRSYLRAGFLPVEYDYRMQFRWEQFLRQTDLESVQMLYEDGTPYRMIRKDRPDPPVRFGVLGAGRGKTIMEFCRRYSGAELVAVCDSDPVCLEEIRQKFGDSGVALYSDFDTFLTHDMDIVVLANYANQHAPLAIRALKAGRNVFSELLPVQTMAEAVELVEAVEASDKLYIYGENCCYMPAPKKMRKLFACGAMGEFQYGEGEYLHNCETDWHHHSHSEESHWRNHMSAFYYCTHSLGPIIRASGRRPVSVTGFEAPFNKKMYRMGAKAGPFGVEMVTLDNGAIVKSLHGVGPVKYSLWFSCQGEMGVLESVRDIEKGDGVGKLLMDCDTIEGSDNGLFTDTDLTDGLSELADGFDHGGGDYYLLYNTCEAVKGNRQADVIGVYEALDMFLPGMFAYFSVLAGGVPMAIPDLRDPAQRDVWRHDTRCTDPTVAGDQLIPSYSKGDPDIPQSVYQALKDKLAAEKAGKS